jgi:hypothetical protein
VLRNGNSRYAPSLLKLCVVDAWECSFFCGLVVHVDLLLNLKNSWTGGAAFVWWGLASGGTCAPCVYVLDASAALLFSLILQFEWCEMGYFPDRPISAMPHVLCKTRSFFYLNTELVYINSGWLLRALIQWTRSK